MTLKKRAARFPENCFFCRIEEFICLMQICWRSRKYQTKNFGKRFMTINEGRGLIGYLFQHKFQRVAKFQDLSVMFPKGGLGNS